MCLKKGGIRDVANNAVIDFGDLSQPATVLIEKISDAVGGLVRTWQIKRIAEAEAKAEIIKAVTRIEIDDLNRRALHRLAAEEGRKQANMEAIAYGSTKYLSENPNPANLENDWIAYMFERCRNVSDPDIQDIWSRILAQETNDPGTVSRTTLDSLSKIDRSTALNFVKLTSSVFIFTDGESPNNSMVYYLSIPYFRDEFLNFTDLHYLSEIGLITISTTTFFNSPYCVKTDIINPIVLYGPNKIKLSLQEDCTVNVGNIILTKAGNDLFTAIDQLIDPFILSKVLEYWTMLNYQPEILE